MFAMVSMSLFRGVAVHVVQSGEKTRPGDRAGIARRNVREFKVSSCHFFNLFKNPSVLFCMIFLKVMGLF